MPRAIDRYERDRKADKLVRPIAVTLPDGSIAKDPKTGQPFVHVYHDRPPAAMICEALFPHLIGWHIQDARGKAVPFNADNLFELFEDHLSVPIQAWFARVGETWVVRDNGDPFDINGEKITPELDTVPKNFALYVSEALWKKETFDSDPTVSPSSSP